MLYLYDDPKLAFSQDEPLPPDWTVKQGLDAYLMESGFQIEHYDAKSTPASFMGVSFSVPNTPKHREMIKLHDLHHVATGFGTDMAGEGHISAWEFRKGLKGVGFYVGIIIFTGMMLGLFVSPKNTIGLLRAEKGEPPLFGRKDLDYEGLLSLRISELRSLLGLPESGLFKGTRGLDSKSPNRTK